MNITIRCLVTTVAMVTSFVVAPHGAGSTPSYDNVHIQVPDPAKAVEWYQKYVGATSLQTAGGAYSRVQFGVLLGRTLVAFQKTDSTRPSAGTVIDHIAVSVPDLDATMKDLAAGGATIIRPPHQSPGLFRAAVVEDPWGSRIEVVQDTEHVGLHHVHLRVPDPEATLAWYQTISGERRKLKGRIDGVRYGDFWLLAEKSGAAMPTAAGAINSIGFQVSNLEEHVAKLKNKGVKFTGEPRTLEATGTHMEMHIAFVQDPNGVPVELMQPGRR